jgi:type I restriction enzyme S subunit
MRAWSKTTFGEVSTGFLSGGTPDTSQADFWTGDIPWITSKWLGDNLELTSGEKFISIDAVKKSATKIVPKDSIIFATRVGVGKVGINRIDLAINQDLAGVLIDNEKYDIKFIAYQLGINPIQQYVTMNKRGATIKGITRDCLEQIRLNIPPLAEQKKIAHILSTVQRAIEAQERIIQTTTELKKALMQKLFTEGLCHEPQKQTEIGLIPESWATPTVESVCTIKASAMSYSQLENASNVANGVYVIGIKVSDMNLPGNEIEVRSAKLERQLSEKEALKRTVPTNSIVFPKRGAAIATNKKRLTTGWTVLDPNLIAVMPTKVVNHRYLFHWFNTFDLKKITDPGPTPQLNKKDIAPLKFPMPPIEEQQAIAAAIDAAEEKATLHIQKRDQFQDLFRTLLHELMTAKTSVHKLNLQSGESAA